MRPPAQVLSDLFDALATMMAEVNPADQDAHNAEIAKVKDQIEPELTVAQGLLPRPLLPLPIRKSSPLRSKSGVPVAYRP